MANVFGNPITNATLEKMPEYRGKTITPADRAHVALMMKNAGDKDVKVRQYVEDLKNHFDRDISTQCLFYNATGDPINLVLGHDFQGTLGNVPYPSTLENGQWGAVLHVSWFLTGSIAAVVYRGKSEYGDDRDYMLSWCNPYNKTAYHNGVLTEVNTKGHYESGVNWGHIQGVVEHSAVVHSYTWNGSEALASIGSLAPAVFEGILTLPNV